MLGYSIAEAPIGGTSSAASTETPTPQPDPTSDAPRFARLFSDISKGAWQPSTGNDLYAMVNEVTPDSSTYISTRATTRCRLAFGPVADPGTSANQALYLLVNMEVGGRLVVELEQGSTVIASKTFEYVAPGANMLEMRLTSAECDAITNYRDLYLALIAN